MACLVHLTLDGPLGLSSRGLAGLQHRLLSRVDALDFLEVRLSRVDARQLVDHVHRVRPLRQVLLLPVGSGLPHS